MVVPPTTQHEEEKKEEYEREVIATADDRRDPARTDQPGRSAVELPPLATTEVPPQVETSPGSSEEPGSSISEEGDPLDVASTPPEAEAPKEAGSSGPEDFSSALVPQPSPEAGSSGKMKSYSGKGRRHNDEQIDEILDEFLQYGHLPKYVSDRQRRSYRKHKRLELRRMYLEQAGLIASLSGIKEGGDDVSDVAE